MKSSLKLIVSNHGDQGEADMDKINSWLGKTLRTKGNDIFRMKGVIAVKGWKEKFVFHGVHMMVRLTTLFPFIIHTYTHNVTDTLLFRMCAVARVLWRSSREARSASGPRTRRGRTDWSSSAETWIGRSSGLPSRPASRTEPFHFTSQCCCHPLSCECTLARPHTRPHTHTRNSRKIRDRKRKETHGKDGGAGRCVLAVAAVHVDGSRRSGILHLGHCGQPPPCATTPAAQRSPQRQPYPRLLDFPRLPLCHLKLHLLFSSSFHPFNRSIKNHREIE